MHSVAVLSVSNVRVAVPAAVFCAGKGEFLNVRGADTQDNGRLQSTWSHGVTFCESDSGGGALPAWQALSALCIAAGCGLCDDGITLRVAVEVTAAGEGDVRKSLRFKQSCTSSEYVCGVLSASLQDAGGIALQADFTTVFVVLVDVATPNTTGSGNAGIQMRKICGQRLDSADMMPACVNSNYQ
ncbi:hypothetical protein PR003_g7248 [Phytophthora rubi]|uniref:Uncharacterized protein n=1 Tax=Phytophthora rubi TaxID=129364 RepID=A0A6A3JBQ2_9STRA|nr:hypothetical protein PR001_g21730 [Phytophthora rubi]KAE9036301.1 hypothetical protein PR002_g7152 [Phytophthora rubi]KAE9346809.1 hypothetical protein PR003_g7248 [Phytophthora rubi]